MTTVLRQNFLGRRVDSPIMLDRRRRRLSTIARRHADHSRPFVVSRHRLEDKLFPSNDTVVKRKAWKHTLIGPEDTVVITYLPVGGAAGSTGLSIGLAIASVALIAAGQIWAAPLLATSLGISSIAASAIISIGGAAIMAGGAYILSRMNQTKDKQKADEKIYGVSGGGNLARPGDRIPRRYGHAVATDIDLSQPDYIVYSGADTLLYKRITLGLGYYRVKEIQVGKAILWKESGGIQAPFNGASIEIIDPGSTSSLVPGVVKSVAEVQGVTLPRPTDSPVVSGPFLIHVPDSGGSVQLDYTVPQVSAVFHSSSGDRAVAGYWNALFEIAAADVDGNPTGLWSTLHNNGYFAQTTKPIRTSALIALTPGYYIVQGRNTQPDMSGIGTVNEILWDGLRVHENEQIIRPHVTEIAMVIKSGPALGITSFADVSVEYVAKLEVWNGSIFELQETRKAVHAYVDVLRGACGGVLYGGGVPDSEIDLGRMRYYEILLSEFDTWDGVIRGPVSVLEASNTILGVMRGEACRLGNAWSMTRDEARQVTRRHAFTRRQIAQGSTKTRYQIGMSGGASDVIGEWNPNGDPRRRAQHRETFGSLTNTPRRLNLTGISNYDHAVHYLKWYAASAYYRRRRRSFTTAIAGRLIERNDPATVDAYFMNPGSRAAGVLSRDSLALTLDSDIEQGTDQLYALVRDRKNRQWGPVKITVDDTSPNVIHLDETDVIDTEAFFSESLVDTLANDNEDLTSLLIGPATEVEDPFIIESVEPQTLDIANVVAVEDNPTVWEVLGETIPPGPPGLDVGDLIPPNYPTIAWLRAIPVQHSTSLNVDWSVGNPRNAAMVIVELSYDDWATVERISTDLSTSGSYPIRHQEGIEVRLRAYPLNAEGVAGQIKFASFFTFKPQINSNFADIALDIEMLSAQLQEELRSINEIGLDALDNARTLAGDYLFTGREGVRSAVSIVNAKLDELASLLATHEGNSYEHRENVKLVSDGKTNQNFVAIQNETTARIVADDAQVVVTTALASRLTTAETNITATATAVSSLTTRVTIAEGTITVTASAVTVLQSQIDLTTSSGMSIALNALTTRVTSAEGTITATATSVTVLQSQINLTTSSGVSIALSFLETRVTSAEGNITASASAITFIQSQLAGTAGSGLASALNSLTTTVSSQGGQISAQASSITALQTTVGGHTATLTAYGTSIGGIQAEYGITIDFDGTIGGFVLTGVRQLDGSAAFAFKIRANLFVDGDIQGRHLAALSIITQSAQIDNLMVGTIQIQNGAVSNMVAVDTLVVSGGTAGLNVTTAGGNILFTASLSEYNGSSISVDSGGNKSARISAHSMYIDGGLIKSVNVYDPICAISYFQSGTQDVYHTAAYAAPVTVQALITGLAAGSHVLGFNQGTLGTMFVVMSGVELKK